MSLCGMVPPLGCENLLWFVLLCVWASWLSLLCGGLEQHSCFLLTIFLKVWDGCTWLEGLCALLWMSPFLPVNLWGRPQHPGPVVAVCSPHPYPGDSSAGGVGVAGRSVYPASPFPLFDSSG